MSSTGREIKKYTNLTPDEVKDYLDKFKKAVEENKYTIAINKNRQENKDFIYDYRIDTKKEKEILDSVIRNFGCYSGKVLEMMTHVEMPWSRTRAGLADDEYLDRIIEKDLIAEYFDSIKLKYNMLNISDIRDYSLDLFNKICLDM